MQHQDRPAGPEEDGEEDGEVTQWKISKLLRPRVEAGGTRYYEVKWTGYEEPTVELRSRLIQDVPRMVEIFEKKNCVRFTPTDVFWNEPR